MKERQRQAVDKKIGRKPIKEEKSSLRKDLQKLRAEYRKVVKENKRLRSDIKSLEKALHKTFGRIERLVHDESVERVLRRLNDIDKEKEEAPVD